MAEPSTDGAAPRKQARTTDGGGVMLDVLIHLASNVCSFLPAPDIVTLVRTNQPVCAVAHSLTAYPHVMFHFAQGRCCRALAGATAGDHVWEPAFEAKYLTDLAFVSGGGVDGGARPQAPPASWRSRFERWSGVQRRWSSRHAHGGRVAHVRAKIGHGPIFFTGHAGGGAFIASGDGYVRAMQAQPCSASCMPCDVAGETRSRWRVLGEVACSDSGTLGGSIDAAAGTVCTGSFTGEVALFAMHLREAADLAALSVKRLKSALAARSIPFSDLVEKREFVDRVKLYNALPALERVAVIGRHDGSVIGCSHHGDLLATCGQDCCTKLWSLSARKCLRTLDEPHNTGVDAVFYDPRHDRVFTGSKAATVGMWSAETGALLQEWYPNTGWVWCVKSATNYASSTCVETVSPGDDYLGDGNVLFAGSVDGIVHVFDVRARRATRSINLAGMTSEGEALDAGDVAARRRRSLMGQAQSAPVTGLIPMFAHSRLVTAGFDGCVRVLDLRTYRCLLHEQVTETRLARCDVSNDCIAVGDMDGYLHLLDMNPWRL